MYFLGFVSPVDVCPASREHTLSPRGYELLFLLYTPFVGEKGSWRRMGAFFMRWLPSYYSHVRRTAAVRNSRSDGSCYWVANTVGFRANLAEDIRDNGL